MGADLFHDRGRRTELASWVISQPYSVIQVRSVDVSISYHCRGVSKIVSASLRVVG